LIAVTASTVAYLYGEHNLLQFGLFMAKYLQLGQQQSIKRAAAVASLLP
jgi:hypothetical protein